MKTPSPLVSEFADLETRWWDALQGRDWTKARTFMREDFSITTAGWIDAPLGADDWLASLAGRYRLDHFEYDDLAVRIYGDVAVVQCRCRQRGIFTETGEAWSGTFRYTDVWVRDPKLGWQIAVRQAGMRPPAADAVRE